MTMDKPMKIKTLSEMYEMSSDQIRRITKKQGVLFEEY